MALSFKNGVITDDKGDTYDLNPYAKSAIGNRDKAGNIGALHSFYDAWNVKNQPPGAVTNPTGARLGGAQYNIGLMDKAKTNELSKQGGALLPQITEWYNSQFNNANNALARGDSMTFSPMTREQKLAIERVLRKPNNNPTAGSWINQQPWGDLPVANNTAPSSGEGTFATNLRQRVATQPLRSPVRGAIPDPVNASPGSGVDDNFVFSNPVLNPTGVGAGRGYPSNWNVNNAPGLSSSGEGTTFATNPATGASFETSPLYQWQLKQGEKGINRALRARGRFNSSVGMNTLANFYNALGAAEADKQYGRTFDQQKLGLQAALAEAAQRGQLTGQLGNLYSSLGGAMAGGSERYGGNIADLIRQYAAAQGANVLGAGTQEGAARMWAANPTALSYGQTGANTASLADILAAIGLRGWENYQKG